MPRLFSEAELDALVAAVATSDDGLSIQALQGQFSGIPRRSLQRRLARLVTKRRLRTTGGGPARRYHLPIAQDARGPETVGGDQATPEVGIPAVEADVPLSPAARELRHLIRRPLTQRVPVGYRREFLDAYEPNTSRYLPSETRERLHELGRSPVGMQPAGTYARQIMDRLLVDLSWASSRLEGNTYSRLDTQNLIAFGHYADGKDRLEAQMILNHKAAIEMLVDQADLIGFNRYTLQNLHALLADNLLDAAACGRLRTIDVGVSGTVYQPTAIPQQIEDCFDNVLAKADAIEDAFEQAFFMMVQLPYLQPFLDVNKRVSRLAANIPLIRSNLAPLSFVDMPRAAYVDGVLAVYELNRIELLRDIFVWAYERSCQRYTLIREALPEPDAFRLRYRDMLRAIVAEVVRAGLPIDAPSIRSLAASGVPIEDVDAFIALVINELLHLHPGNIARYRLRPAEFQRWKAVQAGGSAQR